MKYAHVNNDANSYMQIAKSAYFRAKQIRIAFECKEIDFRLFLFKTYVRPILESNTQIWSPYIKLETLITLKMFNGILLNVSRDSGMFHILRG